MFTDEGKSFSSHEFLTSSQICLSRKSTSREISEFTIPRYSSAIQVRICHTVLTVMAQSTDNVCMEQLWVGGGGGAVQ